LSLETEQPWQTTDGISANVIPECISMWADTQYTSLPALAAEFDSTAPSAVSSKLAEPKYTPPPLPFAWLFSIKQDVALRYKLSINMPPPCLSAKIVI